MRGGYRSGAGRPGCHASTAGKYSIDVRRLHREGYLSLGHQLTQLTWQWSDGATINLSASPEAVTFTYRYKDNYGSWRDVGQPVQIIRTSCHYGGSRPWFACPRCNGRVGILYLWNVPLCRKCGRLVYPSQSEGEIDRSWRRTVKIERKLAAGAKEWNYRRPKGMQHETYERLLRARRWEEMYRNQALVEHARRLFPGLLDGNL